MTLYVAQKASGSAPSDAKRRFQNEQGAGWEAFISLCVGGEGLERGQQAGQEGLEGGMGLGWGRAAPLKQLSSSSSSSEFIRIKTLMHLIVTQAKYSQRSWRFFLQVNLIRVYKLQ